MLVDGQLKAETSGLSRTVMVGEIASGEMLGARSAVLGEPCTATVVALTRCRALCFDVAQFTQVCVCVCVYRCVYICICIDIDR